MSATMHDVAKHAAVSVATVSRVLNKPHMVSEETRQHVMKSVDALGYRINPVARNLRTQQSTNIALMTPSLEEPRIIESIDAAAFAEGYTLLLGMTNGDLERAQKIAQMLLQQHVVAGVIWVSPLLPDDEIKALMNGNMPLIFVNYSAEHAPAVSFDYETAYQQLTEHLVWQGHRRIALLNHDSQRFHAAQWRLNGYRKVLEAQGIGFDPDLVVTAIMNSPREIDWNSGLHQLFQQDEYPTAVIAYDDDVAMQVYRIAQIYGLEIPRDLSVVGSGDHPQSHYMQPALTTVGFSITSLGEEVISLLLEMSDNPLEPPYPAIQLPSQLKIRESVSRR